MRTDFAENRRQPQQVSLTPYLRDVLIVAGDIADDLKVIDWILRKLRSQFDKVFYVPGNHELWVRNGGYYSIEKFRRFSAGERVVERPFEADLGIGIVS